MVFLKIGSAILPRTIQNHLFFHVTELYKNNMSKVMISARKYLMKDQVNKPLTEHSVPLSSTFQIPQLAIVETVFSQRCESTVVLHPAVAVGEGSSVGCLLGSPALSFVSFLIFSNELPTRRAITPIDFCFCHLGWLELLFRSIPSVTLKSVFNYLLLVSNL